MASDRGEKKKRENTRRGFLMWLTGAVLGAAAFLTGTKEASGEVNVRPGAWATPIRGITLRRDVRIIGDLTVEGSTTLGNSSDDYVAFNAEIDSNIIPDDDNTWKLGEDGKAWAQVVTGTE